MNRSKLSGSSWSWSASVTVLCWSSGQLHMNHCRSENIMVQQQRAQWHELPSSFTEQCRSNNINQKIIASVITADSEEAAESESLLQTSEYFQTRVSLCLYSCRWKIIIINSTQHVLKHISTDLLSFYGKDLCYKVLWLRSVWYLVWLLLAAGAGPCCRWYRSMLPLVPVLVRFYIMWLLTGCDNMQIKQVVGS